MGKAIKSSINDYHDIQGLIIIDMTVLVFNCRDYENYSYKEAIKRIKEINRKATFHNKSLEIIETYAEKSTCNFDTYVILSELISSFGHSTRPTMEIANVVFLTATDCDLFNEIAFLIFLNNHGSNDIYVRMAKEASEAKEEDVNRIKEQIIKYKKQAEFQTLEEAYNNQKKI